MKEGVASLIFTGQDVLSQLAGCISGCHLPHTGGKLPVQWSAHVFHARFLIFLVRQGRCFSFIANTTFLFSSLFSLVSSSSLHLESIPFNMGGWQAMFI
jgi:hypothetical protein